MRILSKVLEHLFKDFDYIAPFGTGMDYEAYWAARAKQDDALADAMYAYKFQFIAQLIEPGSSVLDIGCGDGSLLAHLRDTRSIKAYGVELSEKACGMARQKGIEVMQADVGLDGTELPQVDYIVMSEVLEHLSNPEDVLLRLKGKFNKRLLVDIPNTGAVNDRLRLLIGRFPRQWAFHAGEHIRFWTITDFLFVCHQLDYEVERYYGLYDPYYQFGLKLWRLYPRLFSRYVLYVLRG